MVTFVAVMILIAVAIAFTVYLIVKKGKILKRWFFAFGGVVLAGIICIAVAVPVTNDKINLEANAFYNYYCLRCQAPFEFIKKWNDQDFLVMYNENYGEEIAEKNEWLNKSQKQLSIGIYWDLNKKVYNKIMAATPIPYVVYENDKFVMIGEVNMDMFD